MQLRGQNQLWAPPMRSHLPQLSTLAVRSTSSGQRSGTAFLSRDARRSPASRRPYDLYTAHPLNSAYRKSWSLVPLSTLITMTGSISNS